MTRLQRAKVLYDAIHDIQHDDGGVKISRAMLLISKTFEAEVALALSCPSDAIPDLLPDGSRGHYPKDPIRLG